MMLNLRILEVYNSRVSYLPIGLFTTIIFLVEIFYFGYLDFGFELNDPYNHLYSDYISNWASIEFGIIRTCKCWHKFYIIGMHIL